MSRRIDAMVEEMGGEHDAGALPGSWVGIPVTAIALTSTNTRVEVPVLRPFRPDRLILSTAAQALRIRDMKIGTTSLNLSVNPIPGNVFSQDSVHARMRCEETATPSLGIQLFVDNPTGAAIDLSGAFLGPFVP